MKVYLPGELQKERMCLPHKLNSISFFFGGGDFCRCPAPIAVWKITAIISNFRSLQFCHCWMWFWMWFKTSYEEKKTVLCVESWCVHLCGMKICCSLPSVFVYVCDWTDPVHVSIWRGLHFIFISCISVTMCVIHSVNEQVCMTQWKYRYYSIQCCYMISGREYSKSWILCVRLL